MTVDTPSFTMILGMAVMFVMAYAEGANDVSKVVATLVGSGIATYRKAILFGTICTALGALFAVVLAKEVTVTLTKGLFVSTSPIKEEFAIAALAGAIAWVLIATRFAMPVSSSHAIVGSIMILGAFVFGPAQIRWDSVWSRVILPMAGSPLIAIPIAFILYFLIQYLPRSISLGSWHWFSAGAASFARGLNDAPKIAALGVLFYLVDYKVQSSIDILFIFSVVTAGMTLGSLVEGKRVTETLAERVTIIDHREGLAANATTAFLVIFASRLGLPVSITHIISFSIIGLGARKGFEAVSWRTVSKVAFSWFVTLPLSGVLAIATYMVIYTQI